MPIIRIDPEVGHELRMVQAKLIVATDRSISLNDCVRFVLALKGWADEDKAAPAPLP